MTTDTHPMEQLAAAPQPSPAAQGDAQEPVAWYVTGCGRLLDEDEAKAEARHIGGTARAIPLYTVPQADSVTAPVGGGVAGMSTIMEKIDTLIASINGAHDAKRPDWKQACFDAADLAYEQIKLMLTATTPPTQTADSVQEDAARYRWLRAALADRTNNGKSHWFCCIAEGHPEEFDAAIDAAMNKGGAA